MENRKQMKILITGGCGHIGSKLIRRLSPQHDIIVVDNMLTQRYCSLFKTDRKLKFYEMDARDFDFIEEPIDMVIHFAAITDAAGSFESKEKLEEVNIFQTKKFIDKCNLHGVKKFIFPSSTSVYGVAAKLVDEDTPEFVNPQSPYAESKIEIENYLKNLSGNMDWVIFRFGTIFGTSPGMRFHTAINKFCWQAINGLPLTVWKDNFYQFRPYLDINDAIKVIDMFVSMPNGIHWNTVYNVLTDNYRLSDIVDLIKTYTDYVDVKFVNTPLLNQHTYKVDDSKIKKIGFTPRGDIKHAIAKTFDLMWGINRNEKNWDRSL